jgi:3-deoxy-7-phosphoheptulonate synthase
MAGEIERALTFMQAIGADPDEFHRVDFHTCHEALVLEYEHAMTRIDSRTDLPYDVSAHFVWIGERTRPARRPHVELFRHIRNPIGVKLGPTTTPDDALALAAKLNPDNEPGRLTFITRFGAEQDPRRPARPGREGHGGRCRGGLGVRPDARQHLRGVLGLQDPPLRRRDRRGQGFFDVHRSLGTWPGGVHVELTGDDVTECVGGGEELLEVDLGTATSRSATRGSTACSPSSSPSSWRRCCAPSETA